MRTRRAPWAGSWRAEPSRGQAGVGAGGRRTGQSRGRAGVRTDGLESQAELEAGRSRYRRAGELSRVEGRQESMPGTGEQSRGEGRRESVLEDWRTAHTQADRGHTGTNRRRTDNGKHSLNFLQSTLFLNVFITFCL